LPVTVLVELRRVLKPGGILATRDAADQHFYPQSSDLDRLWVKNFGRVIYKDALEYEGPGKSMPALYRRAGFDVDNGKVVVGAGSKVVIGPESRKRYAWRTTGQLKKGDPFHQNWLDAGISEAEIAETVLAAQKWAETEDAWYVGVMCDMLGWK
jgi:ubiquinone/menaquinone biosynthesis C-methylase UbiE